jgi:hypothetical protein
MPSWQRDDATPKHLDNRRLAGLRTWPVQGFDEFRVYYLGPE